MKNLRRRLLPLLAVVLLLCSAMTVTAFAADDPTEETGTKMIECSDCGAAGIVLTDEGTVAECESCGGTGYVESPSRFFNTFWSLLPPIIAIALALITKEVYSSLFVGILVGGLLYSNFAFEATILHVFNDGIVASVTDSYNMGILIFLVILGAMVCLMNKAGGSAAFGRWAKVHIKSRVGAQLASILLGCLIFIDDYFNCLTVGSVMRPITDKHNVSRAKLAYIIDATAAPICIIAPISSWAAAVGSNLKATGAFESDFAAFVATIPYNFYALFSIIMVVMVCLGNFDFGPMRKAELRAQQGELGNVDAEQAELGTSAKGSLIDMLLPIGSLIFFAVAALLYSGGYWGSDPAYHTLAAAFGNSSASKALVWASFGAITVAFFLFVPRGLMSLKSFMDCAGEGMKAMMPANTILVLAWTISGVCRDLLQTPLFVKTMVADGGISGGLLPAIIFVVAGFLSFSTGTAWGTFGILIPIVVPVAQAVDPNLVLVCLSATLAGSVFGDHCSPISDTTILSSAGAGCAHLEHVSTQMLYACVVAASSTVGYVVSGLTHGSLLPGFASGLIFMVVTMLVLRQRNKQKDAAQA